MNPATEEDDYSTEEEMATATASVIPPSETTSSSSSTSKKRKRCECDDEAFCVTCHEIHKMLDKIVVQKAIKSRDRAAVTAGEEYGRTDADGKRRRYKRARGAITGKESQRCWAKGKCVKCGKRIARLVKSSLLSKKE